jgi:hypothetical protein
MMRCFVFIVALLPVLAWAQTGFGIRFGADINSFNNANRYPLVQATFTNVVIGPYYKQYSRLGGVEAGVNALLKTGTLPVLMADFGTDQNTTLSAVELDFKVGPRFGLFYPKLGIQGGYRTHTRGFLLPSAPPDYRINPWYLHVPLGLAVELPTQWGAAGLQVTYKIALTNFILNPDSRQNWDGGSLRALNIELHFTFGQPPQGYRNNRR